MQPTLIDGATAPYGVAILRITAGLAFLGHAAFKLLVLGPSGTMAFFGHFGLPGWLGLLSIAVDALAGLALVLGIYSRIAAIVVLPELLGALLVVHLKNGFSFMAPGGGWEYPAFWILTMIAIALIGDGAWAIRPTMSLAERPRMSLAK